MNFYLLKRQSTGTKNHFLARCSPCLAFLSPTVILTQLEQGRSAFLDEASRRLSTVDLAYRLSNVYQTTKKAGRTKKRVKTPGFHHQDPRRKPVRFSDVN